MLVDLDLGILEAKWVDVIEQPLNEMDILKLILQILQEM
jgi:hypothetical protein